MKVANAKKMYYINNYLYCSLDFHYRMNFWDRLKFLIYGEECIIRVPRNDYKVI